MTDLLTALHLSVMLLDLKIRMMEAIEGGQFDFFTLVNGERVALTEEDYIKKMAASNRERASKNKAFGSIPEFNQAFGREENALRARGVSNPKDLIYAGTSPRITSNSGNLGVFNRLDEPNGPADAFSAMGRVPNFAAGSTERSVDTIASLRESSSSIAASSEKIATEAGGVIKSSGNLVAALSQPQKVEVNQQGKVELNIKHSGEVSVKDSQTVISELKKVKAEIDLIATKIGDSAVSALQRARGVQPNPAAPAPAPATP